ncbi:hypothetical protein [Alicyclobacillus sendaiensis]|uniref:hypothetical protein n=1 Tax=Alicyclobacillus sendaiensis TaxID=192387 RepID=UPI0026F44A40|nr:hypothetical protein [Alicyclobacillus sendaiensis]
MVKENMSVSPLDDIRDVRQRAAAILSGRKLQMLEEAGLTVVEQSELERYRKVEAAAQEICANWQMGRPNYWELYKEPPDEFLKLHDSLYPDASDGREWALVDKRRLETMERVAEAAKVWRNCSIDRLGLATNPEEARAHHVMVHNATVNLTKAIEELEMMGTD